jgi:diguanylate cyclase (GGDEF)-like protein
VIGAFEVACPDATAAIGYVYTAVFFRAFYGSGWRSFTRCTLYIAGYGVGLAIWPSISGRAHGPALGPLFATIPLLLIVLLAGRRLHLGLVVREQELVRNSALSSAGARLLGLTDAVAIRDLGWVAAKEICAATTGLRMVKVTLDDGELRVNWIAGQSCGDPRVLPGDIVAADGGSHDGQVADAVALNRAFGAELSWVYTRLTPLEADAWMLVGAPKRVAPEALVAVHSLINQVGLALRASSAHDELRLQADIDPLTGLANRASFATTLTGYLDSGGSASTHVLFVDLDDFKGVNDSLGHRAGDALLVEVADRLVRCVRPQDSCARLGGDEFAVALRGLPLAAAEAVARRMVGAIAEPIHLVGQAILTGASIGIASSVEGIDTETLTNQADVAMYAAKALGKGRVIFFEQGLLDADRTRLTLERELAAAAGAGQLVVHYQPILALPELGCIAAEALVRWNHPDFGLLAPAEFIETAERTGTIVDIGDFVLKQACHDAAGWRRDRPHAPVAVHVNVAARQLDDDFFIDAVTGCLAESGLPAELLVLELTETTVIDSPAAIARIELLASYGVHIAIDDFGTGYASLTTLRALPVHVLKLDRSFVTGALRTLADRTVIRAIAGMSRELGLQIIAEGVEHVAEQRFLTDAGVDGVQGYLYLRPVAAAEFDVWLAANQANQTRPEIVAGSNVVQLRTPRRTV